jgi:hypothetical protein
MKLILVVPVVVFLCGCFPFPVNMQDEAAALGRGNSRVSAGAVFNHLEINAVHGIANSTDVYLQAGPEAASLGIKQTVFSKPGEMALAVVAGGFLGSRYFADDSRGRDAGKFLGGTVNWYDGPRTYSLQLKHNVIDYHSRYNSAGSYDFLWTDRFEHITQLGASVRYRKPGSRYSFKLGIECYLGNERLPEREEFEDVSTNDAGCLPALGASFYIGTVDTPVADNN